MSQWRMNCADRWAGSEAMPEMGGMGLHYVIYTGSGKENAAEVCIKRSADRDGLCTSCFHPVRHMRKKIRGEWKDYYEHLIPGYVFVESRDISELYARLRKSPVMLKVLGKDIQEGSAVFHALTDGEVNWLRKLTGRFGDSTGEGIGKEPVVELSQVGFDKDDQVVVLSGPLRDVTGLIKKINLHKRIAEIEVEMMERKVSVYLGIELLKRK